MSFQIETERLILRDVLETDISVLIAQSAERAGRSGILAYQADRDFNEYHYSRAIFEAQLPIRSNYTLSVALKINRALIGSCGIYNVKLQSFETSIGWHYGNKYWGNGYATEAARALLYIGFELCRVDEIFADCFADNKASIRVMEKIGMTTSEKLGLFNAIRGLSYGEKKSAVRHIITRNKWLARQK